MYGRTKKSLSSTEADAMRKTDWVPRHSITDDDMAGPHLANQS